VKTTIVWVLKFDPAIGAHGEAAHGGIGAIVGQGLDDAKSWATMRAVRERVLIAAISGLENVADTVATRGVIGQDQGAFRSCGVTRENLEGGKAGRFVNGRFQPLDDSVHRLMPFETRQEGLQLPRLAINFEEHSPRGIACPSDQPQLGRQPEEKRTKADPLDGALNN
jgi:hypothetical protein